MTSDDDYKVWENTIPATTPTTSDHVSCAAVILSDLNDETLLSSSDLDGSLPADTTKETVALLKSVCTSSVEQTQDSSLAGDGGACYFTFPE